MFPVQPRSRAGPVPARTRQQIGAAAGGASDTGLNPLGNRSGSGSHVPVSTIASALLVVAGIPAGIDPPDVERDAVLGPPLDVPDWFSSVAAVNSSPSSVPWPASSGPSGRPFGLGMTCRGTIAARDSPRARHRRSRTSPSCAACGSSRPASAADGSSPGRPGHARAVGTRNDADHCAGQPIAIDRPQSLNTSR